MTRKRFLQRIKPPSRSIRGISRFSLPMGPGWGREQRMSEIRVERLTKSFKELNAVDDVTFTFPESEVTCLLGPSGCGKTTLMRMIAGLEKPTKGEIYFGEQRVTKLKPSQR